MKIQTILATKGSHVVIIHEHQSLKEAAVLLTLHNIGALVVTNVSGAPIGILSERDIVRAVARGDQALTQPVESVMTRNIITGSPDDDLSSVLKSMMDGNFRHMPILDQGMLVGMVSIRDLVKAESEQDQGKIDTLEFQITGE